MTAQLWLTAAVSIVSNIVLVLNARLTSRYAARLALQVREIDRHDNRHRSYEESCLQFLAAARRLRSPLNESHAEETVSALSQLRLAVAGIERYGPPASGAVVAVALEAIEHLVRARSDGVWSQSIAVAETACDNAIAEARATLAHDDS
ncbi:hypothetical protein ACIP5Y_11655 [Nocardia sp. NPDC088792]|uniref:hypothetical protein n=1 Tax=Nocardia sp. NPDC088792 TaxID=3364332 RepID=UPI00382F71BE